MDAPTDHDHEMARVRREIAERQQAEYDECHGWALAAFGPDWLPSCRHFLLEKDEEEKARRTGERPKPAATVYTVRKGKDKRHFTVANGQITEHADYKDGFGEMLYEPHPTAGFEHQGEWCPYHRFSLCFAPYDLYHPKTAEQLAALRVSREQKRTEREAKAWAEANPLLAFIEQQDDAG